MEGMDVVDPRDQRISDLEAENAVLRKEAVGLREELAAVRAELAAVRRRQHRQAAPFSKGKKGANPRRPGRKAGQGEFRHRDEPKPEDVTRTVEAPVASARCPCGGDWEAGGTETASITDLPPNPKPDVTLFKVEVCRCRRCGRVERGVHPELAADQFGATAHRLGEHAKAAAHALHYDVGIPVRKVPAVLAQTTGLSVTQSAITQDAIKRTATGSKLDTAYEQLRKDVPVSPQVNTDDTGWRVGGLAAQLMNFNTTDTSFFQIRRHHRNEEVREVVPASYSGVLGTDRGPAYDAAELSGVRQQKCNSHLLKNIHDVMEDQDNVNQWFGRDLKDLFRAGLDLHHRVRAGTMSLDDYLAAGLLIDENMTALLHPRTLRDPSNQTLLNELGWQHARGNLLRYLKDPAIEPTNNGSERELRGGVVARKVSHCNKNAPGAHAHEVFTSLIRTIRRRIAGAPIIPALFDLFRTGLAPPRIILPLTT